MGSIFVYWPTKIDLSWELSALRSSNHALIASKSLHYRKANPSLERLYFVADRILVNVVADSPTVTEEICFKVLQSASLPVCWSFISTGAETPKTALRSKKQNYFLRKSRNTRLFASVWKGKAGFITSPSSVNGTLPMLIQAQRMPI